MPNAHLPDLMQIYIRSCLIGFFVSAVFVGLLIGFDIGRLGTLVLASDKGWLAILMLWIFNGIVFSGVQFAITIMSDNDDDDPHGGLRQRALVPIPIRVDRR